LPTGPYRFFLGGRDLEMVEIRALLAEVGLADRVVDAGLVWGARASAYETAIRAGLSSGETPVLVELADDLSPDIDRSRLIVVDHHGPRSGADRPTSLEQVFDLVGAPLGALWTRRRALVAANDRGHARAMRAIGANPEEIRAIRDADRAAQGVTPEIEAESHRALAAARRRWPLLLVETSAPTASAIVDFLLPEYGGPGETDVLVATPATFGFYGAGAVIARLSRQPGCWYGGALPDRGFWGASRGSTATGDLAAEITRLLEAEASRRSATEPGREP
jgi:hypothetical protein